MATKFPIISRRRFTNSEGATDAWSFKANGVGKVNKTHPYVIANEWIAGNIALFLRLPVPPMGLFQGGDRRTLMFGSVSFERESRPRYVVPSECWKAQPRLCTGIVLFDILVANSDRHLGNLKTDRRKNPTEILVFDHDRTLLHHLRGDGIERLKSMDGRLGISAGSLTGGQRHCLLDQIDTTEHFSFWLDRIASIPRTFIEDLCGEIEGIGVTKSELKAVAEFLNHRKTEVESIIRSHREDFTGVNNWHEII